MGRYRGIWKKRCPGCGRSYRFRDGKTKKLLPKVQETCGSADCATIMKVEKKLGA